MLLAEGTEVRARAVIIATGVSYNRLDLEGADALRGKGVFYGGRHRGGARARGP